MLGVTLFGIFLTPVFFYVIDGLAGRKRDKHGQDRQSGHGELANDQGPMANEQVPVVTVESPMPEALCPLNPEP